MTTKAPEKKKPFFTCCGGEDDKKEIIVDYSEKKEVPVRGTLPVATVTTTYVPPKVRFSYLSPTEFNARTSTLQNTYI